MIIRTVRSFLRFLKLGIWGGEVSLLNTRISISGFWSSKVEEKLFEFALDWDC